MANDYYNASGVPAQGAALSSSVIRTEFLAIATACDKLPDLSSVANQIVVVNPSSTGLTTTTALSGFTIDNCVIGGTTAVAGSFTTVSASTSVSTAALKAADGAAAATIANSTGVITIPSAVLTTADINGGTADGVVIGGSSAAAITGTTITASTGFSGALNGTVGATTPTTGAFTTLTTSSTITSTGAITQSSSNGGSTNTLTVKNTSNTASSAARVLVQTGGTSAGDAYTGYYDGTNLITVGIKAGDSTLYFGSNGPSGTVRAALSTTGLGLGMTPTQRLSVDGVIQSYSTTTSPEVRFTDNGVSNRSLRLIDGANRLSVIAADLTTEQLSIDANGNIGVGVTPNASWSGGSALQFGTSGYLANGTGGFTAVGVNAYFTTSSLGGGKFLGAGYATCYQTDTTSGRHYFYSSSAAGVSAGDAITWKAVLNFASGKTLSLENAATAVAGTGITFPATQSASTDANTLDDYEEGTWTPTITFGGGSTGLTYSQRISHYTKIGNTCFFQAYIRLSNKGSSTGAVLLSGLPFTSEGSSAVARSSVSIYDSVGSTTIASPLAHVGTSVTDISLINGSGGAYAALTDSDFTSNTTIVITGHYKVA